MATVVCALALAAAAPALAQEFTIDEVSGAFEEPTAVDGAAREAEVTPGDITRPTFEKTGNLQRLCGCSNDEFDFEPQALDDIRAFSDEFMAGGTKTSRRSISNLVWAWGQFLDHDVVATVDEVGGQDYKITLTTPDNPNAAEMTVHRLEVERDTVSGTECRMPTMINTAIIDAGTVYGPDEAFLENVLREPNSCKLRTSPGNLLPVTSKPDSEGKHFLVAGDGRVNEHGVLASMHTTFMREHNRLCDAMDADPQFADLSVDAKFNKARKVVIAKFQHITLKQFLPAIGLPEVLVRYHAAKIQQSDISVEFFIAYRFGHDMIPDNIGDFSTRELFDGEKFFSITGAGGSADPAAANAQMDAVLQACGDNVANEVDGQFSDAIRDTLFGSFGEDLASRNIFRGREVGLPGYTELARCFGVRPRRKVSDSTDDAFLGLLRENQFTGFRVVGPTLERILTDQFHRIFFGPGGHYWEDDAAHVADVAGFEDEIRSTSLGAVITANTGASFDDEGFKAGGGLFSGTTFGSTRSSFFG